MDAVVVKSSVMFVLVVWLLNLLSICLLMTELCGHHCLKGIIMTVIINSHLYR